MCSDTAQKKFGFALAVLSSLALLPGAVMAQAGTTDVQDMSDPLAVYTQAGFGLTNRGVNIKIGQAYDTGSDKTAAQNIFELKGLLGDVFGWGGAGVTSDSIDSARLRNFTVDLTNGSGTQIDLSYNFHTDSGAANYSVLKALPKYGIVELFPLVGAGLVIANNAVEDDGSIDSGFSIPGTTAFIGMFGKFTLNEKIWFNYNPNWFNTLAGSETFEDTGLQGHDSVLLHEFAASYQLTPRSNIRLFFNWSNRVDFSDGDQRVEFNYQF